MNLPLQAFQEAVGALREISDGNPGERGRRAFVVALVLRCVEEDAAGREGSAFLTARAADEIERLPSGQEKSVLRRLLEGSKAVDGSVADLLGEYSAGLEESRRVAEADAVITLARSLAPERADLALRAGRVARLQGRAERALALYRTASELDGAGGSVARLAAVGEAVVAANPEGALGAAIRRAVRAGDNEAAAVGLEERARVRRERGDRDGACRDLIVAAARYGDAVDRARVAHQMADVFVAVNDPFAAREALLFALSSGDGSQRDHARARLHTVSRDLGDQLGMRRWRSFKPPALVSLSARPSTPVTRSAAPRVARWRERIEPILEPAS